MRLLVRLVLSLLLLMPGWAGAGAEEPAAPEMIRLVRQDCGACHGMTLKGGLGASR